MSNFLKAVFDRFLIGPFCNTASIKKYLTYSSNHFEASMNSNLRPGKNTLPGKITLKNGFG